LGQFLYGSIDQVPRHHPQVASHISINETSYTGELIF